MAKCGVKIFFSDSLSFDVMESDNIYKIAIAIISVQENMENLIVHTKENKGKNSEKLTKNSIKSLKPISVLNIKKSMKFTNKIAFKCHNKFTAKSRGK